MLSVKVSNLGAGHDDDDDDDDDEAKKASR